jgi:serine/threonine protein kinase
LEPLFGVKNKKKQKKNLKLKKKFLIFLVAPEIIEMTSSGDDKATAADIWSLACTIIELLTGSPPYYALGTMQALYKMVQDEHPPLPPNLSKEMVSFLKACFIKDYKKRPTAEELLNHEWIQIYSTVSNISPSQMQATVRQHNNKKASTSTLLSSINWNQSNSQKENQISNKSSPSLNNDSDDDEDLPNIKEINEDINKLKKEEQELLEMIEKKKFLLYQKNKTSSTSPRTSQSNTSPRKSSPRFTHAKKSSKVFVNIEENLNLTKIDDN